MNHPLSRRHWLRIIGAGALSLHEFELGIDIRGEEPATLAPLNRFPRMVQEHFVAQVRAAEKGGSAARGGLASKTDAGAYIAGVRRKIRQSFGPFPEKTRLNARITGKVERDAYVIEKVIFESRPGFL